MVYKIKCCLGCEERKAGCHGECKKYNEEKAFYEAMKRFVDHQKKKHKQYNDYEVDKKRRIKK